MTAPIPVCQRFNLHLESVRTYEFWCNWLWLLGTEHREKSYESGRFQVLAIAEMSPLRGSVHKRLIRESMSLQTRADVISSPKIDAVAVVTPVWTHYELAKAALENGKHVFVEKPFTSNTAQAEELINLAEAEESHDHGGSHVPVHRRSEENLATARRRNSWESSITTTQRGSI